MDEQQRLKLKRIHADLKRVASELEKVLGEKSESINQSETSKKKSGLDANNMIEEIRVLDRQAAILRLKELKHQELSEVFAVAGGSGTDRKKPKSWLIEQIIWMVFDFDRGHIAIRNFGQE